MDDFTRVFILPLLSNLRLMYKYYGEVQDLGKMQGKEKNNIGIQSFEEVEHREILKNYTPEQVR